MWKQIILILLVNILLVSCQTGFIDLAHDLPIHEINQLPTGKHIGVAWVDIKTIFIYFDQNEVVDAYGFSEYDPRISAFDINLKKVIPIDITTACEKYYIRAFQSLPNNRAGYILDCPKLNSQIMQEINLATARSSDIYMESSIRNLGEFAYSSDMRELILVDVRGRYLESSLYHLHTNGKRINITPDFLRADFPAWSQNRNLIAFLGTKPYLGSDDEIEHFSETERRLDYSWQLYLYNPESLITEELPIDIVGPSSLKWSPDGEKLAFSGEYKGMPGVWVVDNFADPDKLTITRIVDGLATFDFSPDGKSIAFAYIGLQNTQRQNILYIVDLGISR